MRELSGISIKEFEEKDKKEWDDFIENSRNGTFLHKIDYLHYHLDRFIDCSMIIKQKGRIVAVMPGNIEDSIFYTHKGLTFGGLLILPETKIEDVLMYFNLINKYLKEEKRINKVIYKTIPYTYSTIPSQEDEYALFRLGAEKINCEISSSIFMNQKLPFTTLRKRRIKKAKSHDLEIKIDFSYEDFWGILTYNLKKTHNAKPIHTLLEIQKLKDLFNENIKLFSVYCESECVAGVVMYISKNVARVQYISANEKGKQISALDYLFDYLIYQVFENIKYFDFGTSAGKDGQYLNEGLIFQKQGFGARSIVYQQFEYEVNRIIENKKEINY